MNNSEYMKKWREENKEHCREYDKKWREEHKEHHNEYCKRYHKENKEYSNKYSKQHYQDNREKNLEYGKKYLRTEEGKANTQRRHSRIRAKGRKIINTLTAGEWLDILEKHNFKCAYCGKDLFNLFARPERDHVIPISRGGDNIKENIIPACHSCNVKKHNKLIKI